MSFCNYCNAENCTRDRLSAILPPSPHHSSCAISSVPREAGDYFVNGVVEGSGVVLWPWWQWRSG